MNLRDALKQSPANAAGNNCLAWGYASIASCVQREDGKIVVEVFSKEREYQISTYDNPEEASTALYSEGVPRKQDYAAWDGTDTWYPRS
jgi:hypothetical protein